MKITFNRHLHPDDFLEAVEHLRDALGLEISITDPAGQVMDVSDQTFDHMEKAGCDVKPVVEG